MEFEYIEKLVELVSKNELTELSVEDGEQAVVIRKDSSSSCTCTGCSSTCNITRNSS